MKTNPSRNLTGLFGALALIAMAASGCVDEEIVFRDRPLFEDLPAGAQGFVGYSDQEAKRTVCGACHIGAQARWATSAHADAWATLAGSGASQTFCEACHTVSERGNPVEGNAGWVATGNPRYYDVQCEACHGPGFDHVTGPDTPGNQPIATLALGPAADLGCAECHSGVHRPFAEEWLSSAHGGVTAAASGRAPCAGCHEAKGILRGWGVKSVFNPADEAEELAITCAVCHDPHEARHDGQLRFAVDVPAVEQNLCMKCHSQRGTPDMASFRSPHAPEGPLLLGFAGWWPPNLEWNPGDLQTSHGSEANPRLCAGCHVTDFQISDPATGSFQFRSTGHTFEAIPCVDSEGLPTGETDCALTERSFRSCLDGCHGSEGAARSALVVARDRIDDLADDLDALLAQVDPGEFGNPGRYTTADGSRFNVQLARRPGSEAHNPFLVEALLRASIRQVETEYGLGGQTLEASASTAPATR
jgi:predicted CXXCH cytochrome family protein